MLYILKALYVFLLSVVPESGNVCVNIYSMKYIRTYGIFESKKKDVKDYMGKDRIILIGPPTVGKSTISKALAKSLDLEVVSLDRLQAEFGYGEDSERECVAHVLSEDYEGFDKPSILDFGGGHVYKKDAHKLLKGYRNIFVLVPSEDIEFSRELLEKGHERRLQVGTDRELKKVMSAYEKGWKGMDEGKAEKMIELIKKVLEGGAGKIKVEDLPPNMKSEYTSTSFYKSQKPKYFWDVESGWRKYQDLFTNRHDRINRSITDNVVEVYTKKGVRRSKAAIVKEILGGLVKFT